MQDYAHALTLALGFGYRVIGLSAKNRANIETPNGLVFFIRAEAVAGSNWFESTSAWMEHDPAGKWALGPVWPLSDDGYEGDHCATTEAKCQEILVPHSRPMLYVAKQVKTKLLPALELAHHWRVEGITVYDARIAARKALMDTVGNALGIEPQVYSASLRRETSFALPDRAYQHPRDNGAVTLHMRVYTMDNLYLNLQNLPVELAVEIGKLVNGWLETKDT